MQKRQYVSVEFTRGGRTYAYHNDGEPVVAGERIVVNTNRGPTTADVLSCGYDDPGFPTKPIVGRARQRSF